MFKQLTYFQGLEADLKGLTETAAKLNSRLAEAYTSPDKIYCSLGQQIDTILQQQERLSSVLSVILQQVDCNTFIPLQPSALLPTLPILPEWFPQVLQAEFERVRGQLNEYARSLAVLHELQQKRKAMREEREALELLFRRSVAVSRNDQSTEVDIMQEVQHLRNRIRHVRKTFQHYCQQVANKIVEFVEGLANRTASLVSSPKSSVLKSNVAPVSQIFKAKEVLGRKTNNNWMGQLPQQSFRPHDNHKNISPRSHLHVYTSSYEQPQQDYYLRSAQIKTKTHHTPIPHTQARTQHTHITHTHQHALESSCRNHQLTSTHKHSCELGRDWLRGAKSQERFKRSSNKYDYRKYIPAVSQYY